MGRTRQGIWQALAAMRQGGVPRQAAAAAPPDLQLSALSLQLPQLFVQLADLQGDEETGGLGWRAAAVRGAAVAASRCPHRSLAAAPRSRPAAVHPPSKLSFPKGNLFMLLLLAHQVLDVGALGLALLHHTHRLAAGGRERRGGGGRARAG